jgi:hypothetical protein
MRMSVMIPSILKSDYSFGYNIPNTMPNQTIIIYRTNNNLSIIQIINYHRLQP